MTAPVAYRPPVGYSSSPAETRDSESPDGEYPSRADNGHQWQHDDHGVMSGDQELQLFGGPDSAYIPPSGAGAQGPGADVDSSDLADSGLPPRTHSRRAAPKRRLRNVVIVAAGSVVLAATAASVLGKDLFSVRATLAQPSDIGDRESPNPSADPEKSTSPTVRPSPSKTSVAPKDTGASGPRTASADSGARTREPRQAPTAPRVRIVPKRDSYDWTPMPSADESWPHPEGDDVQCIEDDYSTWCTG